jgi:TatD DNase family protein
MTSDSVLDAALRFAPGSAAPPLLVDIGANLGDEAFASDREEVLARARSQGVRHVLLTGTSVGRSRAACQLARELGCWFTAGVHPHDASEWDSGSEAALRELSADVRCVALGECGLDYNRNLSPPEVQRAVLAHQLRLAGELRKPVFLHCREAAADLQTALQAALPSLSAPLVVHCFTGSEEEVVRFLALGPLVHVGFTGWLCDEREGRAEALARAVQAVPLDRLLLETDAPYLTPRSCGASNKARPRRNEPALLPHVAAAVAAAKGLTYEEVAAATTANALRVFGLRECVLEHAV